LAGAATHAYLPLLSRNSSVYAQVKVGCDTYEQYFGRKPVGIWLPECGYRPPGHPKANSGGAPAPAGLDRVLAGVGLRHFFVDAHAIQGGTPVGTYGSRSSGRPAPRHTAARPGYTTYLPYLLRGSGICVLGRNERTALQVWSSEWGYPGDGNYREFHKRDSISGLHYWKVTSRLTDLASKEVYQPDAALARAGEHADHFVGLVERLLTEFHRETGKHGVIVAPFDVELFGHWWLEGLDWLRWTLEGLARSENVELTTSAKCLEQHPPTRSINLVESSWGLGGAHYIWDNEATGWMWEQIHDTEAEMERAVGEANRTEGTLNEYPITQRLLRQAGREALLLQSSDWPFLVTTEQAADYASRRFLEHRHRFTRLVDALGRVPVAPETLSHLEEIETIDAVFPNLDQRVFAGKQGFSLRR
ncbi:MAG: 1,4-alpha-glucan branching protein domain-containing protein, partial [Bacillota bacterium]